MPNVKRIIFLKDRLRDDIEKCWLEQSSGKYVVVSKNGDGKQLRYRAENVDILEFKKNLETPFRVTRSNDGVVFHNVLGIRVFSGKSHKAYRVLYEYGSAKNYPSEYLKVEEHIDDHRSLNVLDYLREVAITENIGILTDPEKKSPEFEKYSFKKFISYAKDDIDGLKELESYLSVTGR